MSFWPTSDELRAGIGWIKRHPYISGSLAAVAVGTALVYWFSEEENDPLPKLPRQADFQPASEPGSHAGVPVTQSLQRNAKVSTNASTPSMPGKRSVGWVDSNGGVLETQVPVRTERTERTSSLGMTLDASMDIPCTGNTAPVFAPASGIHHGSSVNDQSSISTTSTHASSQDSIDSVVFKPHSAPSSPRVPTTDAVLTPSPIVTGQSIRSPSPLAVLQSQGFSGTSASGIGVVPDLIATPVKHGFSDVVITSGMVTPEDQQTGDADWGHFMTPQVIPSENDTKSIPGQSSDERRDSADVHHHRPQQHRGKRAGQHHKKHSHK